MVTWMAPVVFGIHGPPWGRPEMLSSVMSDRWKHQSRRLENDWKTSSSDSSGWGTCT